MSKLLAIVPAYNEAAAIAGTVARHPRATRPSFDVLVVDDGSTDAHRRRPRARGRAASSAIPFNLGIGGAVQSGYQFALEHGYDVAVQVDGDGQHDARHIPRLLDAPAREPGPEHGHGLALPRPRDGDGYRSSVVAPARHPHLRRRPVAGLAAGRVTDPTSGFRMTDRRGIELFARDYPHDYPEVEAVLMSHAHRLDATRDAGADARAPAPARPRSARRSRSTT